MAKRTIDERIDQLKARTKTLEARRSYQSRARDTRRKVLLGALLLHGIEHDPVKGDELPQWVEQQLPGFLSRVNDLAIFEDFLAPETGQASLS